MKFSRKEMLHILAGGFAYKNLISLPSGGGSSPRPPAKACDRLAEEPIRKKKIHANPLHCV